VGVGRTYPPAPDHQTWRSPGRGPARPPVVRRARRLPLRCSAAGVAGVRTATLRRRARHRLLDLRRARRPPAEPGSCAAPAGERVLVDIGRM